MFSRVNYFLFLRQDLSESSTWVPMITTSFLAGRKRQCFQRCVSSGYCCLWSCRVVLSMDLVISSHTWAAKDSAQYWLTMLPTELQILSVQLSPPWWSALKMLAAWLLGLSVLSFQIWENAAPWSPCPTQGLEAGSGWPTSALSTTKYTSFVLNLKRSLIFNCLMINVLKIILDTWTFFHCARQEVKFGLCYSILTWSGSILNNILMIMAMYCFIQTFISIFIFPH